MRTEKKISYILKIDHSFECYDKNSKKSVNTYKTIKDYDDFKSKCYDLMNKSSIYDRKIFKNGFRKIYNENNYNFPLQEDKLNNLIANWKLTTNKFNKFHILENTKDNNGRNLLREFRIYCNNYNSYKL